MPALHSGNQPFPARRPAGGAAGLRRADRARQHTEPLQQARVLRVQGPAKKFIANGYTRDGLQILHGCPGRGTVLKLHRLATWRYTQAGAFFGCLLGVSSMPSSLTGLPASSRMPGLRVYTQAFAQATSWVGQILSGASRRCAQAGWAGDGLTRPRSTSPHQNLHGASRGSTRPQSLEPEHATRLRAVVKSACQRVRPACRWSSWPCGQPC